jgi:WD40 repeat protein
MLKIIVTHVKK